MPTPPLSDELAQQALDAWTRHHRSMTKAASELGIPKNTLEHRLRVARTRGFHLSPGARNVIDRARLSYGEAKGGWIHDYDGDGKKIGTTRWAAPEDEATSADTLARIREAFEGMTPADPVTPPEHVMSDLCTMYPLMDAHVGMLAWGKETGKDDYDLEHAASDVRMAFAKVTAITPPSKQAVLLVGGDYFHIDDSKSETPGSHHRLDSDGRFYKIMNVGVGILMEVVHKLLQKHERLLIRVLRGNHDEHSHYILTVGLAQRMFNEPRVYVEQSEYDLFQFQWGKCGLFAHHGDKEKPVEFVLKLADICPFWTATPHRYAYTGHKHKMEAERIGGVEFERLDAFCPPDVYGSRWAGRRRMHALTYHTEDGLILRASDPISRVKVGL